jgi:hypothetical protein
VLIVADAFQLQALSTPPAVGKHTARRPLDIIQQLPSLYRLLTLHLVTSLTLCLSM